MRKFVITTTSECGDHNMYFIEHDEKPTYSQINEWLKKNGSDYEEIEEFEEIIEFQRM